MRGYAGSAGGAAPAAARTMRIHQLYAGSAISESIADSMLFIRSLIGGWGIQSEILTARPGDRSAADARDLLLIHQSDGDQELPRWEDIGCRKALVCHDACRPSAALQRAVEAAIAISPSAARALTERGFPNVTVIPLVKDFAALRSAPHERAHYHDETAVFRLLSSGGIAPDRDLDDIVDFLAAAQSIDGIPIELVLLGGRDDNPVYVGELEARIRRLGIARQVRMTGAVADDERFGRYRSATACISLREQQGFDVSLLEAMAFERPVVAYRSAGASETLAGAGIMVEGKDARAILTPLLRLHRDRAFRRDIIRAQRRRLLGFSREHVAGELASWLRRLDIPTGEAAPTGGGITARRHYVIEGPFESSYSLAGVNRNLAASLHLREDCAGYIEATDGDADYAVDIEAAARLPQAVTELVHPGPLAAERIVAIRNTYPCRPNGLLGDLRLVHLAWEESGIPAGIAELMNLHLDGVLVPSEYCKRVVRDGGVRLPIAVIGHGIDHEGMQPPPPLDRTSRGRPSLEEPFLFLNISAGVDRKGIEELVTAYSLAFSRRDPVLLLIKTYHNDQNTVDRWVARVTGGLPDAPAIQVVFDELSPHELETLYARADALVLPTRGEGFNLPAAEAMARGLPVIVTRHSGHLDFCSDENCFLLDCRYELSTSYLQVPDSVWARPSLQHLVTALKTVSREARTRGSPTHSRARRAVQDVADLRWSTVAERIDRFVQLIETRPVAERKLRLAWVSPYNAQDPIAECSGQLIRHLGSAVFDTTVFAADLPPLSADPPTMRRAWHIADKDLAALRDLLLSGGFDTVFLHHDFRLFDTTAFTALLHCLEEAGIDVHVLLHAGIDAAGGGVDAAALRSFAAALAHCTRVFLHGVDDMNRLKGLEPADNLVLLPDGVIDQQPLPAAAVRVRIGLDGCGPIIGASACPQADLRPLLDGFLLLLRRHPAAFLLIVERDLPEAERARLLADIDELGIAAQVRLSKCRDGEEAIFLLSACDAVFCPDRSATDAVRLALASGRPVAVPPEQDLAELSDLVYRLLGSGAIEIAEGLASLIGDAEAREGLAHHQRRWVKRHGWAAQAERIGNILGGCWEERHGAELRPPLAAPELPANRPPPEAMLPAADIAMSEAPMKHRSEPSRDEARAEAARQTVGAAAQLRRRPGFLRKRAFRRAVRRADRARGSQEWILAARSYRRALKHRPGNAAIWVQYGHALKECGNLAVAEDAYRRAIALAPAVADSHLQLGHLLKLRGRPDAAAAAYLTALQLDPQLAPARKELAALGWTGERVDRALLLGGDGPVAATAPEETGDRTA